MPFWHKIQVNFDIKHRSQQIFHSPVCILCHRKIGIGIGVGAAIGAVGAIVAAPLVIGALGFGAGGVVAGSTAAGMMSAAGNVAAGKMNMI